MYNMYVHKGVNVLSYLKIFLCKIFIRLQQHSLYKTTFNYFLASDCVGRKKIRQIYRKKCRRFSPPSSKQMMKPWS